MIEWNKYIGLLYNDFDCWSLIRKIYQDKFNIDIGAVEDQAEYLHQNIWLLTINERIYDVITFNNSGEKHVGMVLGHNKFIHTIKGSNCCIENYRSNKWKLKIRGIYRHKQLMQLDL